MSNSIEARLQELEEKVSRLEKKNDWQRCSEEDLIKHAKQYARIKMLDCMKNRDNQTVFIDPSQKDILMRTFLDQMIYYACNLIRADAE